MARDPYRYFRIEAQELLEGLTLGLLDLEKLPDVALVRRLLRQAHTLKGAARVVKLGDIGNRAHELEDILEPYRESGGPAPRSVIDEGLRLLDQVRAVLETLQVQPKTTPDAPAPDTNLSADGRSLRVAVSDLDALLESSIETHAAAVALRREGDALREIRERGRALLRDRHATSSLEDLIDDLEDTQRKLQRRIETVATGLGELRACASELRLVPAKHLMDDLERAVRDASRALDRSVSLDCKGTDVDIDAHVMAGLRAALVHVVRNGVAHGIEDAATRAARGKPTEGRITVSFARRGHLVSVRCEDDGGGIDWNAIRAAAVRRRLLTSDEAASMPIDRLEGFLFGGGITTATDVSGIAGRGVGLEAVRHAVDDLGGEVRLETAEQRGTRVEIIVPLSLSALPALTARVGATTVLIPLDPIVRTVRFPHENIWRDEAGACVTIDDETLRFTPLALPLGQVQHTRHAMQSGVIIESAGRRACYGVDELGATQTIVVRSIPAHAVPDPVVLGAAFDEEGAPRLVLSPRGLVKFAWSGRAPEHEPPPRRIPPILVIDDSLTTRMLEQSILESAGYTVDLAVSGEEGLRKAREKAYGLFIVDVEMPGMDGFTFISRIREDSDLAGTPAILVTSRSAPEDRRRGKEVGARAYIVKSEFDQEELLRVIEELL